jgi:SPP1 gp7 family putative phage head morphogenesis protein
MARPKLTPAQLAQRHIAALNAQIDGFTLALEQIGAEWKPKVLALLADLKDARSRNQLRALKEIAVKLQSQLNDLGYTTLAKDIVTSYDKSAEYALKMTDAVDAPKTVNTTIADDLLKQVKALDLSAYHAMGADAVRELARNITMDAVSGVSRSQIIKNVQAVIDKKLVNRAKQYVDTATRQFDRTVSMKVWKQADIKKYKYFGPKDSKNRDFCSEHVGKVYTVAEIEQMDNGFPAPWNNVMVYGGGISCRHVFSPNQD